MDAKKRIRLNLELHPDVIERLGVIQEMSHASNKTEVIRRALSLYDRVIEHCSRGGKVIFEHPDDETQERLMII